MFGRTDWIEMLWTAGTAERNFPRRNQVPGGNDESSRCRDAHYPTWRQIDSHLIRRCNDINVSRSHNSLIDEKFNSSRTILILTGTGMETEISNDDDPSLAVLEALPNSSNSLTKTEFRQFRCPVAGWMKDFAWVAFLVGLKLRNTIPNRRQRERVCDAHNKDKYEVGVV